MGWSRGCLQQKSWCYHETLSSTAALSALQSERYPSGEHAQDIGRWSRSRGSDTPTYRQNTSEMPRMRLRRPIWLGWVSPAARRRAARCTQPIDARRYGDQRSRATSPASMNSTVRLLGVHACRLLTHLTVAGLSFPRRPRHEVVCQQSRDRAHLSTGITSYACGNVIGTLFKHSGSHTASG